MTVMPCSRPYSAAARETLPAPGAAVHPHVLDAELAALAHRLLGELGPGADHDRLDAAGDRAQVVVGRSPSTSSAFGLTANTS